METVKKVTIAGTCAATGAIAASAILPALGFSAAGISALSYAAAWQSSIGNVAVGSTFAALQSIGVTGSYLIPAGGAAMGAVVPYGKTVVNYGIGATCYVASATFSAASAGCGAIKSWF